MNSQSHIHRIWHRLVRKYYFCNLYNQLKENRNKIFKENIKEVKDVSQNCTFCECKNRKKSLVEISSSSHRIYSRFICFLKQYLSFLLITDSIRFVQSSLKYFLLFIFFIKTSLAKLFCSLIGQFKVSSQDSKLASIWYSFTFLIIHINVWSSVVETFFSIKI